MLESGCSIFNESFYLVQHFLNVRMDQKALQQLNADLLPVVVPNVYAARKESPVNSTWHCINNYVKQCHAEKLKCCI